LRIVLSTTYVELGIGIWYKGVTVTDLKVIRKLTCAIGTLNIRVMLHAVNVATYMFPSCVYCIPSSSASASAPGIKLRSQEKPYYLHTYIST